MNWQYDPSAPILLATAAVTLGLALHALHQLRRGVTDAGIVSAMLFAVGTWTLGSALVPMAAGSASRWLAVQISTLGVATTPSILLILVLAYVGRRRWLDPKRLLALALVPTITVLLGWTDDLHGLMWRTPLLEAGSVPADGFAVFGVARWLAAGFNHLAVAGAALALIAFRRPEEGRTALWMRNGVVLLGAGLAFATSLGYRLGTVLLPVDLTPVIFAAAGLALSSRFLENGHARLLALARHATANAVSTPVLVLDEADRVIDLNLAAQHQFGLAPERVVGKPLTQFIGLPIVIGQALRQAQEEPTEITLTLAGVRRIYLLKSSPLAPNRDRSLGRVIVWNDITEQREAEREVRKNEIFLKQVIDNTPHHLSVMHPEGRYLLVNKAKADFHDLACEDFVGATARLFLDAQEAEIHTRSVLDVLETGAPRQIPATPMAHGVSGRTHWFETTVTPLRGLDGTPLGVLSVATDVTRQRLFEKGIDRQVRFEQLINRISGEFINQEPDTFDTTIVKALGAIARFVLADGGGIMRLDDERQTVTCSHEWFGPDIERRQPAPETVDLSRRPWWLNRLQMGETVFIPHLSQLSAAVRASLRAEQARSLVAIPISVKERLQGYVYLVWLQQQGSWQQNDVALLKFVGDLFATVFERQRADAILRDSEKRFRLLAENATDLISLTDPSGVFTYVSPASTTLLGYRPEELEGRHFWDFFPPDDLDWQFGAGHEIEPRSRTVRVQHRDGRHLWVERIGRGIVDPDSGKVVETQSSIRDVTGRVEVELRLMRANTELNAAYDATIEGWARALELRDEETQGHSQRVTDMTVRLGRALGLSEAELLIARRGALLHDMGKLGVPDRILHKPGKLSDEEWKVMHKHPSYAYEWLKHISFLRPALDIPYCHHEKWDGSGYPRGLKGEEIPLLARMFAVVDVYDALMSDRPYRAPWSQEKVLAHIRDLAGTHFDPQVVEAFLAMITSPEQPGSAEVASDPFHILATVNEF